MRTPRWNRLRPLILTAGLALFSSVAAAYSYWVFFPGNASPFAPVPARFDLNALKDRTVLVLISDQGPGALAAGDSTTAIYSQVQQAAAVWDGVAGSALRLRFGGFAATGLPQNTPGIDVVFDDDMPPGLLAQTTPTFPADLSLLADKNTTFVPILRARVQLRRTLTGTGREQPSFTDAFFGTVVHEFGHALGLQHSFASGAMSTAITRATTKGLPLTADDIAGISQLYPAPNPRPGSLAAAGTITGRVLRAADGAGINLASVVALSTKGAAVSALTNPDGTYRITGLPPGQYYVYAHPLPPSASGEDRPGGIFPPADPQKDDFSANTGFGTQFFPGTKDWTQAALLNVAASATVERVDFAVAPRSGPAVYGMTTYGFQNGIAVPAPPLPSASRNNIVFYAPGTTANNQTTIAPGLSVSVIGQGANIEAGSLRYYTQGYLLMVVDTPTVSENLPTALAVTVNDDLYVLPSAFTVVTGIPPSLTAVINSTVFGSTRTTVTGANLNPATRVLFDGVPAKITAIGSDGTYAEIVEPPAPGGHQAAVEAVNPDGQTSLQALGPNAPLTYTYPARDAATLASTPNTLTAGTDVTVAVTGVNTRFAQGQTVVGFGSSDIAVRRSWVVNPQLVLLNVSVDAAARVGATTLTAVTGLESVTLPAGIQVLAADPAQASLRVPVINQVTGLAGVPAGGIALIATKGLPASLDGWTLTIGGVASPFTADKNGILAAKVPGDLAPGPQTVQLLPPAGSSLPAVPPVLLQLDAQPPVIISAAATAADGTPVQIATGTPALGGQRIVLTVSGLAAPSGVLPPASDVWVNISGVNYPVTAVALAPQTDGAEPRDLALVTILLPASLIPEPNQQPPAVRVMAGTGTRLSTPYALPLSPPAPAQ